MNGYFYEMKNSFQVTLKFLSLLICGLGLLTFIACSDDDSGSSMDDVMTDTADTTVGAMASSGVGITDGSTDTSSDGANDSAPTTETDTGVDPTTSFDTTTGFDTSRRILAIGDSNTAGKGVAEPWPDKLELSIGSEVYRRGIGGQNSSQGLARLPGLLAELNPTHVCILYGTNDAIQQLDPAVAIANVGGMVDLSRAAGATVIVGSLPPILADDVTLQSIRLSIDQQISSLSGRGARIARISEAFGEGIGLMQDDGLHANDAGHAVMAAQFRNQF